MSDEKVGTTQFYLCRCFHTDNIYLEDYKLHVRFVTEQQFRLDYREVSVRTGLRVNKTDIKSAFKLLILHHAAVEEARVCDRASV